MKKNMRNYKLCLYICRLALFGLPQHRTFAVFKFAFIVFNKIILFCCFAYSTVKLMYQFIIWFHYIASNDISYLIISTFTTGMVWHLSHYIYVYYRYGLTFIVTSGGYRELVNIGDGSITGVEFYNGVSVQDTLEFKFNFNVPVHCIQSASCTENPMKLEKDVTTVTIVTKTILFHLCCMKNETNYLICNHCICNTWFLFYPPRLINVFLCIISIKQCITFGIFCFFLFTCHHPSNASCALC
jgi:hypothetical protein